MIADASVLRSGRWSLAASGSMCLRASRDVLDLDGGVLLVLVLPGLHLDGEVPDAGLVLVGHHGGVADATLVAGRRGRAPGATSPLKRTIMSMPPTNCMPSFTWAVGALPGLDRRGSRPR